MAASQRRLPVSRRRFVQGAGIVGLGLLVGCDRLPGQAQSTRTLPRVGLLSSSVGSAPEFQTIREALRGLGYIEGQTILFDERHSEGHQDRLPALAAELVALPVDVIIAAGTEAALAAKQATRVLPIVAISSDPLGTGLVDSLAHPGGNLTGISAFAPPLAGKRLELLREVAPGMTRVAVVWNGANPARAAEFSEAQRAAAVLDIDVRSREVRGPTPDLDAAFSGLRSDGVEGLVVLAASSDPWFLQEIAERAAATELPAMYPNREYVRAGGLLAYGVDRNAGQRRTAYYVDRILKGTPPADLPVEQPMRFEFAINLKTAQALGLTIPRHVLLQATELIQ